MRKTASSHNERSNENDDGAALEARDLEGAAREVREFAACRARPLPVVLEAPSPYVTRRSLITRHVPEFVACA